MNKKSTNQNVNAAATDESASDLQWQAFLYIAGEMSDRDHEHFEAKLGNSQVAREAVASAVNACQCVDAALGDIPRTNATPASLARPDRPEQNSSISRPTLRPLILAGAAACLAIMVGIYGGNQWNSLNDGQPSASFTPVKTAPLLSEIDLAEAWADSDWESTLVVYDTGRELDHEADLLVADNELDSDWMITTLRDLALESPSAKN